MRKSKKEYPFEVITILPKGSPIGSKNKETIRHAYYKTIDQAQKDVDAWTKAGYISKVVNR